MDAASQVKQIYEAGVDGIRRGGRPDTSWFDVRKLLSEKIIMFCRRRDACKIEQTEAVYGR